MKQKKVSKIIGKLFAVVTVVTGIGITCNAQSLNNNWESSLNKELQEFLSCDHSVEDGISPCNKYVGTALKTIYNIDDFYSKSDRRYMLISEIYSFVEKSDRWTLLGKAYEKNTLTQAQNLANNKKAVVAVFLDETGIGHVSYILPGDMKMSGSWGFDVPNSASFFTGEPENSYVGKPLSYAFGRNHIKGVKLYARVY